MQKAASERLFVSLEPVANERTRLPRLAAAKIGRWTVVLLKSSGLASHADQHREYRIAPSTIRAEAVIRSRQRTFRRLWKMKWILEHDSIDWDELSNLYKIAPLGDKKPEDLKVVFSNSMYKCFVFDNEVLVGAGRALADGVDCSYICDMAVHPDFQGIGLGKAIIDRLKELSAGHRKIILYAKPGKEGFYEKMGFKRMRTAMAIFKNQDQAMKVGLVEET